MTNDDTETLREAIHHAYGEGTGSFEQAVDALSRLATARDDEYEDVCARLDRIEEAARRLLEHPDHGVDHLEALRAALAGR